MAKTREGLGVFDNLEHERAVQDMEAASCPQGAGGTTAQNRRGYLARRRKAKKDAREILSIFNKE